MDVKNQTKQPIILCKKFIDQGIVKTLELITQ